MTPTWRSKHRFFIHMFRPFNGHEHPLPPGVAALGITGQAIPSSVQGGRTTVHDTNPASKERDTALPTEPETAPKKEGKDISRTHEFWTLMRLQDLTDDEHGRLTPPEQGRKSGMRKLFRRHGADADK